MIRKKLGKSSAMASKYGVGQQVMVKPASNQSLPVRDSSLEPYVGQTGKVTDYHWISPRHGEVFYIYTVRIVDGNKKLVLYEDEIEAVLA